MAKQVNDKKRLLFYHKHRKIAKLLINLYPRAQAYTESNTSYFRVT